MYQQMSTTTGTVYSKIQNYGRNALDSSINFTSLLRYDMISMICSTFLAGFKILKSVTVLNAVQTEA